MRPGDRVREREGLRKIARERGERDRRFFRRMDGWTWTISKGLRPGDGERGICVEGEKRSFEELDADGYCVMKVQINVLS